MSKLIILRGNSGSGKTTVAKALQEKLGYNTMRISQDEVRRNMLWVKDGKDTKALPLMAELLKYGKVHSELTILEGIMYEEWYSPLFKLANELYESNIIEKDNYDILLSDLIDDQYWNFAYSKNITDLNKVWKNIKCDMEKHNRQPVIYITSNVYNKELQEKIKENNLKVLYTDVWMIIEDLNSFKEYKSKINFKISRVDENLKSKFIQAIMDGFAGDNPDDPYESLSDGYRVALEKSMEKSDSKYKVINYVGLYNKDAISTATVLYKDKKAIIYNVTTNKNYQKQGVCKQTMSEIINNLKKIKIETVCVLTEQGFYTEQVYKNMGFKEVMLGKTYIE